MFIRRTYAHLSKLKLAGIVATEENEQKKKKKKKKKKTVGVQKC